MRATLHRLSGIAIVLLPIVIVWVVVADLRTMRAAGRSVAAEEAVVDSLRVELRNLQAQVKKAGEEIKDLPESAQLGRAFDEGFRIAKRQENVEGLITRSRNRIRNFESTRADARRHMIRLASPLAAAWGLFGFVFRRTKRPSAAT